MSHRLKLHDVRAIFRLIGEVRELGADPTRWRQHMVRRLRKLMGAAVVVSSEVHLRQPDSEIASAKGLMRIIDVGWGCDGSDDDRVWEIRGDSEARPEAYMLALLPGAAQNDAAAPAPVRPTTPLREGKRFIFSQYPLPHLGAVDQLGVHQQMESEPFTPVQQRLMRLFHVELGRLWKRDALNSARDPTKQLPPRLGQTLAALQAGASEKQISLQLGISPHTVHNYVKALHQRIGVSSRGELLAKTHQAGTFLPRLSVERKP
ncbi:MAG TPA: helix-turn-helix transcriptional regulator [Humisphaera sp.]|jgi:DNA-binding CsgD family transcriptional regulator|nr:helix-turn-helix transcriptional regulator [Humisphaera sp.]